MLLPALTIPVAGLLLALKTLSVNFHERAPISALWFKYHLPFYHHRLHWLDAANFAAWIVPILLCFLALPLARQARTGAD